MKNVATMDRARFFYDTYLMHYVGAYVIRGNEATLEFLLVQLAGEKVIARGSPDLFVQSYRKFGVDEAEDLRTRARMRPIAGERRVFTLYVPTMTHEAQNALLKTLEEPVAGALFFLVVPSPEMMLSTILSRVQRLSLDGTSGGHVQALVGSEDFLAATTEDRLTMLKPLYDYDEDESKPDLSDPAARAVKGVVKGRDIGAIINFLQSLEVRFAAEKMSRERTEGLRAIYRAREYVADKGSLLKVLLEQVALLAPRI